MKACQTPSGTLQHQTKTMSKKTMKTLLNTFLIIYLIMALSKILEKTQYDHDTISIASWNARGGLFSKYHQILKFIDKYSVDIMLIQETQLKNNNDFTIPGFDIKQAATRETSKPGTGLLVAVRRSHGCITHSVIDNDQIQSLTIQVQLNKRRNIYITNVYRVITDNKAYTKQALDDTFNQIDPSLHNLLIMGDFNVKDHYETLISNVNRHDLELHSDLSIPTRIGNARQKDSVLDLVMSANRYRLEPSDIMVTQDPLGSDHLPVLSTWNTCYNKRSDISIRHTTKFNFKKADWNLFEALAAAVDWKQLYSQDTETYLQNIVDKIHEIAEQSIPNTPSRTTIKPKQAGRSVPWWDKDIDDIKKEKLEALSNFRTNREQEAYDKYRKLRNLETKLIRKKKKDHLKSKLDKINEQTTLDEMWKTVKGMDGSSGPKEIPTLRVDLDTYVTDKEKADAIATHLEKISSDDNLTSRFREVRKTKEERNKHLFKSKPLDNKLYNAPIHVREVKDALIKKDNKSSPGEDSIPYVLCKHLPHAALIELTTLFNQIWTTGAIPRRWKHGIVVPLLKPDKNPEMPVSYRPISLTDHLGKILETIVNNRLTSILTHEKVISKFQSGFRSKRQTLDQLIRIKDAQDKCRILKNTSVVVMLDLEKAYDMLWRRGVLIELDRVGISGCLYNYVLNFLEDRTFQVRVGQTLSDTKILVNGTPQGAVISPTLFNVLINVISTLPDLFPRNELGQFADDTSTWIKPEICPRKRRKNATAQVARMMSKPLTHMLETLEDHGYKVNVEKTGCIFLNSKRSPKSEKQEIITVKPHGKVYKIKGTKTAKCLGVTFDKTGLFTEHLNKASEKGQKALNILRYVGGRSWGFNPNIKNMIYKNFMLPKVSYGEEIYHTGSKAGLLKLDRLQNAAMRQIAGLPRATHIKLLEILTGNMPLSARREVSLCKLWTRFRANPENPANEVFENIPESVDKRHTARITMDLVRDLKLNSLNLVTKVPPPIDWNPQKPCTNYHCKNILQRKSIKNPTKAISDYLSETFNEHIV